MMTETRLFARKTAEYATTTSVEASKRRSVDDERRADAPLDDARAFGNANASAFRGIILIRETETRHNVSRASLRLSRDDRFRRRRMRSRRSAPPRVRDASRRVSRFARFATFPTSPT